MSSISRTCLLAKSASVQDTWMSAVPTETIGPRLVDHTHITKSFHELKFNAAAWSQVVWDGANYAERKISHLIASPYNDELHLLDLDTLDEANRMFALALTFMKPIREDYATASYEESFNWTAVFSVLQQLVKAQHSRWIGQSFYVVVFRSKRGPSDHNYDIHELDAHAHQEAMLSGGLLKYWFGDTDEQGQNLATCIWRSRDDAKRGGAGPGHVRAMRAAATLYKHFDFKRFAMTIEDDVLNWGLSEWQD